MEKTVCNFETYNVISFSKCQWRRIICSFKTYNANMFYKVWMETNNFHFQDIQCQYQFYKIYNDIMLYQFYWVQIETNNLQFQDIQCQYQFYKVLMETNNLQFQEILYQYKFYKVPMQNVFFFFYFFLKFATVFDNSQVTLKRYLYKSHVTCMCEHFAWERILIV